MREILTVVGIVLGVALLAWLAVMLVGVVINFLFSWVGLVTVVLLGMFVRRYRKHILKWRNSTSVIES